MPFINSLYFRFRNFFSSRWPQTYLFCERRKSFFKFVVAGCFSGGSDLIFLFILHGLWHLPIVMATSISFILSFLVSFTLQKFWTFRNYQNQVAGQLSLYILFAFVGLNVNAIFMHLLVTKYRIWYILAQLMVNLVIGFCNFLSYKFIIFRKNPNEIKRQENPVV